MKKPNRASLETFAQMPEAAQADAGSVQQAATAKASADTKNPPKINVYLTAEEIRTLKLIGIDSGQTLTEIGAIAIREWLERNGHARSFNS